MGSISITDESSNRIGQNIEGINITHGERLLPQVVDDLAVADPGRVVGYTARYNSPGLLMSFIPLTAAQLCNAVNFTSHLIDSVLGNDNHDVIGFIGMQDYRYWVMKLAAIKTGHPLLVPSIRNAVSNTVNLITASKCSTLYYSGLGTPIETQAQALAVALPDLKIRAIPSLEELSMSPTIHYPFTKTFAEVKDDTILILHTSGSTGHPKPIKINHAFLNRLDVDHLIPSVQGRNLANLHSFKGPLYNGSPFFHLSGVILGCAAMFLGTTNVIPPPEEPATPKTARDVLSGMELKSIIAAPSIIDHIFTDHGEELKKHFGALGSVVWFGGPLAHSTGKWVTTQLPSTHLFQLYGSTESSIIPLLVSPKSHWSYLEFHPDVPLHLEPISPGNPLHEAVIRRHPDPSFSWATPVFYLFPEKEEWRTRDLFSRCPDPGYENLWKFESRVDDILILNNALKVNPLHIEVPLLSQPLLKGVMVFGAGKVRCGILIEARDGTPLDGEEKERFVERVWLDIQRASDEVPEHARIHRDLLVVADRAKPMARSVKMGVVRSITTKLYAKEIEDVYAKEVSS